MTLQQTELVKQPADDFGSRPLIRELTLRNLLSFGPDTPPLPLHRLNVLIGPNGAGKSNLIEALDLLRSTPDDLAAILRRGGGVLEWIWKGTPYGPATIDASVDAAWKRQSLGHVLQFASEGQSFRLLDERLEERGVGGAGETPRSVYQRNDGRAQFVSRNDQSPRTENVDLNRSILSQRRSAELYPEITHLAEQYEATRIYREWSFGRNTVFRRPQPADARNDQLEEDLSNLGLVLNRLRRHQPTRRLIVDRLGDLYEGLTDFDVSVEGGTVQVFLAEGDFSIPATRLSDGTLRYLCLLAILCDPKPPPLVCLEEPELGLHPDILPKIGDLLIEASQRTQLIVTTHSNILLDALSAFPEYVVVCEKHEGRTEMSRLDPEELAVWLERYRLGQLWTRGDLGGTRW